MGGGATTVAAGTARDAPQERQNWVSAVFSTLQREQVQ